MITAKSCLEAAKVICPRALPQACSAYYKFNVNKEQGEKNNVNDMLMRWILLALVGLVLSACSDAGSDSLVPEGRLAVPISSVAH